MPKSPEEKAADKAAKKAAKETTEKSPEETTDVESDDSENVSADDEEIDPESDTTALSVQYINPEMGLTERAFSHEVHGKNFKKLAAQFAEKFNGTIL